MRPWIEKLGRKIQKEGQFTGYHNEVMILNKKPDPDLEIYFDRYKDDCKLFINKHFDKYSQRITIVIYRNEYDYLLEIFNELSKKSKDQIIDLFNSYE